jgi:3-phosphoshikimate 1-carboxyvinyltransferase
LNAITPDSPPRARSFRIAPGGTLRGEVRVPGDKSISHRAIMLGALAYGETVVTGFLEGADSLATLAAFRAMGVEIEGPDAGRVRIRGVGLHGLTAPAAPLDVGNAGTAMRLLCGLLAGQRFASTLVGDASLSRRPMRRVTEPLAQMGASIETTAAGTAPLLIRPVPRLTPIDYAMPVASAQVKSCLLLAGLYADGTSCITEPAVTRDHTERMLATFGCPVQRDGRKVCIRGGSRLTAPPDGVPVAVPADISSAAFFLVGASIAEDADLLLPAVGLNPTRIGVLNILEAMGARLTITNHHDSGAEPVADIRVQSAGLKGIEIPAVQVPLAIDEFPALFIAAACAEGETLLTGAEELRVKESDRIAVMAAGLGALGVETEVLPDGIRIQGRGGRSLGGGSIDSHGDHRIAMAFAMAALRAEAPLLVQDCENVNTSFPGFARLAAGAGLGIEEHVA